MTQEMLREDYYVLAPLIRENKKILLCQNIITKQYEFFTFNGYNYVKVDDEIEKGLRQTFKNVASDVVYFNISELSKPHKEIINLQHNKAKFFIEQTLKHTDPMTKLVALGKVNSLTYKHFSEDIFLTENIDPNQTLAYYRVSQNTVYYSNEEALKDLHVLTHELTHCASNSNQNTGFITSYQQSHHKASQNTVRYEFGRGLNEGATEYYTSKSLNEEPQSYELLVNIFANLKNVCDPRFLDTYFFNNKVEYIKDHISSSFHYDNNYQIEKLIAQCDALYIMYREDIKENDSKNSQDILSLAYSCYTTLIDMYIHKYKHENINLDDKFLFDNFLDKYALDSFIGKNVLQEILPKLETYFALACEFEEEKTQNQFLGQDTRNLCTYIITHIAQDKSISENVFNESTKTIAFYHMMLSDWSCIVDDTIDPKHTKEIKKKVFKTILSANYLPQNPKMQEKVAMMVLQDDIFYDLDAVKYLPPKLVLKVFRKNPQYELACFVQSPIKFLPNLICGFSDKTKQDKSFRDNLYATLKYIDKQTVFTILKNYYSTLSNQLISNPKIVEEIQEGLISSALTQENQNEISEFLHQMDNNTIDSSNQL